VTAAASLPAIGGAVGTASAKTPEPTRRRELTVEQLDPLGGVSARIVVISAGVAVIAIAVAMSVTTTAETRFPLLQGGAILTLAGAAALLVRQTSTFRPAFTRWNHIWVQLLLLTSVALNAFAQWGTNTLVRDDWAPVTMAILLLVLAPFRPAAELAVATLVGSSAIALLAVIQTPTLITPVPALVFPLVAVCPVLGAGLASAAISHSLVRILAKWHADGESEAPEPDAGELAGDVMSARAAQLNAEVIPFLAGILAAGTLTAAESDRARELASKLREVMVASADASWLIELGLVVNDQYRLSERMNGEQRGAVRALMTALYEAGQNLDSESTITIDRQDRTVQAVIRVPIDDLRAARSAVAPYISVLRVFFPTCHTIFEPQLLRVELEYLL
jgi:hypothetical protein